MNIGNAYRRAYNALCFMQNVYNISKKMIVFGNTERTKSRKSETR